MTYENAPCTQLLATHCCACGRPLRDALSVELGIGPVCREKYGMADGPDSGRAEANAIVHVVASKKKLTLDQFNRLNLLGYRVLADRLRDRLGKGITPDIIIQLADNQKYYIVKADYIAEAVNTWRDIPGRRWDGGRKCNTVPVTAKRELAKLLEQHYLGKIVHGPKGLFRVGGAVEADAPEAQPFAGLSDYQSADTQAKEWMR